MTGEKRRIRAEGFKFKAKVKIVPDLLALSGSQAKTYGGITTGLRMAFRCQSNFSNSVSKSKSAAFHRRPDRVLGPAGPGH